MTLGKLGLITWQVILNVGIVAIVHDSLRGRVVDRPEAGQSQSELARKCSSGLGIISKQAVLSPERSTKIALGLAAVFERKTFRQTVNRRLASIVLNAWRPVLCVPLTGKGPIGKTCYCGAETISRGHHKTDESRFTVQSDSRRVFIWRESEAKFHLSYLTNRTDLVPKEFLCVGIMYGSRTPLYVFDASTVNSYRYRDEVLEANGFVNGILETGGVMDKCVQMWTRNYDALSQTARETRDPEKKKRGGDPKGEVEEKSSEKTRADRLRKRRGESQSFAR
ncbi:hypothetical protein TNCV_4068121 [Trichonephila clavipes]|nr:hypothetical protein TNCV_4068121 [Trichonephila clavipes]